ncbi:hypothetical protein [Aromatoleum toluclasticum]|uniref:hypothetical protein n=1 Tax=Aromatoleum toluclasticum TaxID=92003 RepID=UPI00036AC927|nr:hypothetical protein [Aromatoleum toluclasticum]
MKNPNIAWFNGVFRDEAGQWMLDALMSENGQTAHRPVAILESARMDMTSLGQWAQMRAQTFFEETSLFLAHGQKLVDARPLIRKLSPGLQVSNRHAVFRFDVGSHIYLVPGLFIIGRLFLSVRSVAKYVLQPGMFESFVDPAPLVRDGTVTIRLPPHLSVNQCSEGLARALAWLAVDESAARAWRSVWYNAMDGRIDLTLPEVTMHGRLGGIEIEGMRLVTWSREVTFNTNVPGNLQVTSKRGTTKVFKRGNNL